MTRPFFWYPLGVASELGVCETQSDVQQIEIGSDINTIQSVLSRFYDSESKMHQ